MGWRVALLALLGASAVAGGWAQNCEASVWPVSNCSACAPSVFHTDALVQAVSNAADDTTCFCVGIERTGLPPDVLKKLGKQPNLVPEFAGVFRRSLGIPAAVWKTLSMPDLVATALSYSFQVGGFANRHAENQWQFERGPLAPLSERCPAGFDRGHLLPFQAAAHVARCVTFFNVNYVCQRSAVNAGVWAELEKLARALVMLNPEGRVHVLTGPLDAAAPALPDAANRPVRVPVAVQSVLVCENCWFPSLDGSYEPAAVAYAVSMANEAASDAAPADWEDATATAQRLRLVPEQLGGRPVRWLSLAEFKQLLAVAGGRAVPEPFDLLPILLYEDWLDADFVSRLGSLSARALRAPEGGQSAALTAAAERARALERQLRERVEPWRQLALERSETS